ncbi:acetyltransferase [Poriferisphaera sp. WC338]|uniref:acetyltransferase n=1 Tax=Poriferisphaera sp. WC338 TaxID=3425129 RepID=UPI003D815C50
MISDQGQNGRPLLVYGAGGHGHVVAEAATASGFKVLGFIDDQAKPGETGNLPLFQCDDPRIADAAIIVAIGHNMARRRLLEDLKSSGREIVSVIHPTAHVAESAVVSDGAFIGPNAVVHTKSYVGEGAIVNSGAILEHHSRLGDHAHLAPGAVTGGEVSIGEFALVGLGARILPQRSIGNAVTVGAGALVANDIPANLTVIGIPAVSYTEQDT